MYIKSRECATAVVNMVTRVDIVQREKKTTAHTAKMMDATLNNVTARRSIRISKK